MKRSDPDQVHRPLGAYSHMITVAAGADLIFVSGQVGADRQGVVRGGAREQARQALANLMACLRQGGLSAADVVRLTVYLTDASGIEEMAAERRAVFGDTTHPTSTFLVVTALARPDLLVEIDAIAAKEGAAKEGAAKEGAAPEVVSTPTPD